MLTIHFTVAYRAGNLTHNLRNEEFTGMHKVYGAVHGNAREAVRLYQERCPNRYMPGHELFMTYVVA